jgi:hypothetical protein
VEIIIDAGMTIPSVSSAVRVTTGGPTNVGLEIDLREDHTLQLWFKHAGDLRSWVNRVNAALQAYSI